MITIGYLLIVAYFIFLWHFFPTGRKSFDVFKLNPNLLPYWWKFIGIGCLVLVFLYSIIQGNFNPSTNSFLLAGMYFGLLQIAFSKEKREDELDIHIRLKAMYISMISMFFIAGVYSSFEIISPNSISNHSFVWFMILLNATLIVYLSYFYYTKYGVRK